MMLLVDIGNTRVKWASWSAGELAPQRAAEHAAWSVRDWQRELFAGTQVGRVLAATVAGAASRDALQAAAVASGVQDVEFVASTASACGVTNAYPQPASARRRPLDGADRRLAPAADRVLCRRHRHRRDRRYDRRQRPPSRRLHRAGSAADECRAARGHQRPRRTRRSGVPAAAASCSPTIRVTRSNAAAAWLLPPWSTAAWRNCRGRPGLRRS